MKAREIFQILLIAAATAYSTSALAGWVTSRSVATVRAVSTTGGITFTTVEPILNPNGCSYAEFYAINSGDNPKNALAILLAAKLSGATVDFYMSDTGCDTSNRPRVTDVLIN